MKLILVGLPSLRLLNNLLDLLPSSIPYVFDKQTEVQRTATGQILDPTRYGAGLLPRGYMQQIAQRRAANSNGNL